MAMYHPDYELIKAKEVVENLGNSEKDQAIKYYIDSLEEREKSLMEKIKKYQNWFEQLNGFLPKHNRKLN